MSKFVRFTLVIGLLAAWPLTAYAQPEPAGNPPTPAVAEAPVHAPAPHGGEAEGPSLLSPDLGMAVWQVVLFLVLLAILGKFAWPAILRGLQDRETKIRSDLTSAEQAKAQAQAALAEYQARIAAAHQEARAMLDQTTTQAEAVRAKLLAEAQTDVLRLRQQATNEIKLAKQQALQDIYATTADLATAVAGKLLGKHITDPDTQRLVDQSLAELNKSKAG